MARTRTHIHTEGRRRQGRPPATSHAELERIGLSLFAEQGYEETSVDDIAAAAGIGRRTFFCYFPSKADLVWGDFDAACDELRRQLAIADPNKPVTLAIRDAVVAANYIRPEQQQIYRQRVSLILHSPAVVATSINRYQQWRTVVEEFVADRLGVSPNSLVPRSLAYSWMGFVLAAYEQWLLKDGSDLRDMILESFDAILNEFADLLRYLK